MGCNRNAAAVPAPTIREAQSLQHQQFEERLRIADRLVQDLREAGYSCEPAVDAHAQAFQLKKLRS
jgi:hypothetical protein